MIARIEAWMRRARRLASRSEWLIRLLGLTRAEQTETEPGLVLIQIDGLSRTQLARALAAGHMPFLSQLLTREGYRLRPMYSGLPASTPAVQGELMYGIKTAVPAFSFRQRDDGQILTMYVPGSAQTMERRLERDGLPLLQGGSAYCDIFTGGAAESHFCASSMGMRHALRTLHPLALPLYGLFYLDAVVRILALMAVEAALSLYDVIRGTLTGKTFLTELQFVLTRVGICILLRELITSGAKIDIARGLPVIHVNFIGYDEQAHRRGPSSWFAHWTLRGIDKSISRLWQAAHRSHRRSYDVWIYSDHGQEDAVPYGRLHTRTVEEAVSAVFGERAAACAAHGQESCGGQARRMTFWRQRPAPERPADPLIDPRLVVTAMGSLGHIYPSRPSDSQERDRLAQALVAEAGIPLILTAGATAAEARGALAYTAEGRFELPAQAAALLGGHPYQQEVANDLVEICHHPDAGTFVMSGWRRGLPPLSFPDEHGSHTGPGLEETNAFSVLPSDAPLPARVAGPHRPWHLREAVNRFLGRAVVEVDDAPRSTEAAERTLRVVTYNVHGCIGMDGRCSPGRIARVIARLQPDIVALQELDVGRPRSSRVDQVRLIAERLGMSSVFQPTLAFHEGQYGNAVLSRYPMHLMKAGWLPRWSDRSHYQPRAALWVTVDAGGTKLELINAHLSVWPNERLRQAEALLGAEWLGQVGPDRAVVLCGDLNAQPDSPVCRLLAARLRDAQRTLRNHRPLSTFAARYPVSRIDHVFVDSGLKVVSIAVPATALDKLASDHLPLVVEIDMSRPAREASAGMALQGSSAA